MSKMIAIRKVVLREHHLSPGRTSHYIDGREFAPFKSLAITTYPGDSGCYLMHITADGQCADTWHETLDDAFHQAEYEFEVRRDEWEAVNEPFGQA